MHVVEALAGDPHVLAGDACCAALGGAKIKALLELCADLSLVLVLLSAVQMPVQMDRIQMLLLS